MRDGLLTKGALTTGFTVFATGLILKKKRYSLIYYGSFTLSESKCKTLSLLLSHVKAQNPYLLDLVTMFLVTGIDIDSFFSQVQSPSFCPQLLTQAVHYVLDTLVYDVWVELHPGVSDIRPIYL